MPVVPSVMVLYSNDAVEVRYSDGSLLQLSPCGSAMLHRDPTSDEFRHPLSGVKEVQKRTQFVTSAHRDKIIQALDFRNRFAQRPFLCSNLIPLEDIVSLYTKIDKIAWPKTVKDLKIEVLEDGSRCAISRDEYASLVLSPHSQDFTVCYLSQISSDEGLTSDQTGQYFTSEGISSMTVIGDQCTTTPENAVKEGTGDQCDKVTVLKRNSDCSTSVGEEPTAAASGVILSDGLAAQKVDFQTSNISLMHHEMSSISRASTPDGLRGMVDCDATLSDNVTASNPLPPSGAILHSSPVTLANADLATHPTNCIDNSGIKGRSVSIQTEDGGAKGTPGYSLVVEPDETLCLQSDLPREKCRSTNISGMDTDNDNQMLPACTEKAISDKQESPSVKTNTPLSVKVAQNSPTYSNVDKCLPFLSKTALPVEILNCSEGKLQKKSAYSTFGSDCGPQGGGSGRYHYTWVTQHISCNDCPAGWRHPLRILQEVSPSDYVLTVSECNLTIQSSSRKGFIETDTETCIFSPVISPLPLSCPFQHLHTWQLHSEHDDDPAQVLPEFKQGQFKVIMMEGVVYRFVQLATMRVVEIYPGDGSVFVSQGITARFFSHIMWKEGKVQEKTYSVKVMPPDNPRSLYSVRKLIKRGHRLLSGFMNSTQFGEREELPCWKHIPVQIVKPLPASVLEECTVPGYGRFTAFSNGRIRVVFDDRTTLDMISDFSRCSTSSAKQWDNFEHNTGQNQVDLKMTRHNCQLSRHHCQLLLPTGKYVTVEACRPGVYRRYVDAAKEWIEWVQSSAKERRQFYQRKKEHEHAYLSAEVELKKIECFNYIVQHTGVTSNKAIQGSCAVQATASTNLQHIHTTSPVDLQDISTTSPISPPQLSQNLQHISCDHISLTSTANDIYCNSLNQGANRNYNMDTMAVTTSETEQLMKGNHRPSLDPKGLKLEQGYNYVRQALLKTSQMINEIEDIVKDHKKT